jgi:hypothetical protein
MPANAETWMARPDRSEAGTVERKRPEELRDLRGPLGLPIERDQHFEADKPLSAYANEARARGRIVT